MKGVMNIFFFSNDDGEFVTTSIFFIVSANTFSSILQLSISRYHVCQHFFLRFAIPLKNMIVPPLTQGTPFLTHPYVKKNPFFQIWYKHIFHWVHMASLTY